MMSKTMPILRAMTVIALSSVNAEAGPWGTLSMRTYVSGSGSDNNPCTPTQPCATFQAALALTQAGGEIFVLNSADYGPVTINKALTITSVGAVAGILATNGAAIMINAGTNDVVNLRGLGLDGANSGIVGIQFTSGKALTIQNSSVRNFSNSGILFVPSGSSMLSVIDTTVMNANNGIAIAGGSGALTRVTVSGNNVGILASGSGVSLAVTDTVANNNSYGIAAISSAMMVSNSTMSGNSVGITAQQAGAIVRIGQSSITGNGTGWLATDGGQVQSYGDNKVGGNANDGVATATLTLQ
jgi:hypothetical protein